MRYLTRTARLVCTLTLLLLAGCTPPPSIQTPQGRTAFTADAIVLRVGELQSTVIEAERTGGLPTATARTIVEFTVSANKILRDTPAGWELTVRNAWSDLKPKIPVSIRDMPALRVVWAAVDVAILSLGGAQ